MPEYSTSLLVSIRPFAQVSMEDEIREYQITNDDVHQHLLAQLVYLFSLAGRFQLQKGEPTEGSHTVKAEHLLRGVEKVKELTFQLRGGTPDPIEKGLMSTYRMARDLIEVGIAKREGRKAKLPNFGGGWRDVAV